MKNLPDKIYLNLGDLTEEEYNELDFHDLSEVTWSEDDVQGRNVEYVLKDAFVEKVEKSMIEWAGTYISKTTGGGVGERKVLAIDLLNYFRKYIKEE